ncbi:MAG: gluconate 2-dehydrogenase subunit 3 family protein [Rhodocyclaceae bacterium]|nr:gluconate 2-dehydrogenase subunit 3 family protein [Rhodocyclaceae bacterium]MCA3144467.1 gluconate 2-dehydrogenase subunit 3 family protein [Rhodocyclaceae bacterium]
MRSKGDEMKKDHPGQAAAQLPRREFIKKSGAVAGAAALATGTLLQPAEGWAQTLSGMDSAEARTLLQMCRDVYPHDGLPVAAYQAVVQSFDGAAAKDPALAQMIAEGIRDLNAVARKRNGKDYAAIASENQRVAVLEASQGSPLFQKVRGDMITGIYNNPDVWPLLGYEGPSAHLGGYLKRGFDDISWL